MDGRIIAAGAASAMTVAALGLAALVLAGEPGRPRLDGIAPVLIGRADPAPDAASVTTELPSDDARVVRITPVPAAPPVLPPEPASPPASAEALRPAAPPSAPPIVDHRYDGVLTPAEINRIRKALKLSPDQEPYWSSIATILREVGRQQIAEVDAGGKPTFDLSGDLSWRLYDAAGPLLGSLREDQKEEVRRRAKMLGLDFAASFI